MSKPQFTTIEALDNAIDQDLVDPETLEMHLDGGDAFIMGPEGETLYRDNEREMLKGMIHYFCGIEYVAESL